MEHKVQLAMQFNSSCHYFSETVFERLLFSMSSTIMDFRMPCTICIFLRIGPPSKFTGSGLAAWKEKAPDSVWDQTGYIQDAISRMLQSNVISFIQAIMLMYQLFSYVSFNSSNLLVHRSINLSVCSCLNSVALRVCQVLSLQALFIPGCEDTGIFESPNNSQPAKLKLQIILMQLNTE